VDLETSNLVGRFTVAFRPDNKEERHTCFTTDYNRKTW